jgi:hypothetical protein
MYAIRPEQAHAVQLIRVKRVEHLNDREVLDRRRRIVDLDVPISAGRVSEAVDHPSQGSGTV